MEYLRAQQFVHLHSSGELPGTNIMGVLPGQMWGTAEDRVLVVGAHWDTVPGSGGLDDNGSGEESDTDTLITLCVIRSGGAAGAGQGPAPG